MIDQVVSQLDHSKHVQILVVEDESIIASDIKDCLENLGYSVPAIAVTGAEAITRATELQPDLVLMDIRLRGDMDGIQAAEQIWSCLHIPIVYATGFSDRETLERAKLTRPFGYILKPIDERELYAAIETALHQYRVNQQLQGREQWLTTVLRDIGDGVIVVDVANRIRLMNLVAEALTGWPQTEALGRELSEIFHLIHEPTGTLLQYPPAETIEQGVLNYLPDNTLLISKDGSTVPIADTATPLRDENGFITGIVIIFRDISRRRLAEERDLALRRAQQLEEQMAELQRLNQLKDDFLNMVSHELRTPLANMKMAIQMLEIILDQQGSPSQNTDLIPNRTVHYLEILREQCNQELTLVNDLLDLQRLNAEVYPMSLTKIELQNWIPHVAENFQERIRRNQQQLHLEIPADLPVLSSDVSVLTRILSELLNNACKYTPPGETITISAQAIANGSQNDSLTDRSVNSANASSLPLSTLDPALSFIQIKVCNSGIEILPEELSRIFDQFYRIPNSDFRNAGGTGLGLTLIKKFVTCLNGSIDAESCSRQTCFTIKLPISPPEP